MGITYLLKERQGDENSPLEIATRKEWLEVVRQEAALPKEQCRYFIKDCIIEKGEFDCIYMEVSYKEYLEWNREHMKQERNRQASLNFTHLSLENSLYASEDARKILEELVSEENLEDKVLDLVQLMELHQKLRKWKNWGVDMLELYLTGQQRQAASIIASKYHVSPQRARRYKGQFEKFIKKFLKGVSL